MVILGIDPGVALTGFAIIKKNPRSEKAQVVDFGCISTTNANSMGGRLKIIHHQTSALIAKHKPNIISVESLYFFKNAKTAMPVSQAKGVILLAAAQKKIPVLEFTPLQVKMVVVGYGRAEKKQVWRMAKELLDLGSLEMKEKNRKKDDAADALGVALCAFLHHNTPA